MIFCVEAIKPRNEIHINIVIHNFLQRKLLEYSHNFVKYLVYIDKVQSNLNLSPIDINA